MNTIICTSCGVTIEVGAAMQGEIEARVRATEQKKHELEMARVREEAEAAAKREREAARQLAAKELAGEKELLKKETAMELEMARKRMESELSGQQKKAAVEQEMLIKTLREDAAHKDTESKELRNQLTEMMQTLRDEKKARENAELEAQKKIAAEEAKIRETASKEADERQRLNLAARDKTIADLQKALDDAQRKAAQGSQQLQGEVMELDFERALAESWRDDEIQPVAKGVKGGDIRQIVRSPRGTACGVILWEIKRTKNWTDGWIPKLKEDLRAEKANIPIIVSEALPKDMEEEIGQVDGVWICKPKLALIMGSLLRKGLLDVARQKALTDSRDSTAEALYNFVTSHEFVQQIEAMVETYKDMSVQIQKERIAYEKLWSQREKQTQKLLLSTANIVGSMQGHIGSASMPRIKGLELESDDELLNVIESHNSSPQHTSKKRDDQDDRVQMPSLFG